MENTRRLATRVARRRAIHRRQGMRINQASRYFASWLMRTARW
jgi:hypothetical protein